MTYKTATCCRLCKSKKFKVIVDLGLQSLTGYFPAQGEEVEKGPLILIRCLECNLVQLQHSFEPTKMYGEDYGYRSGLNMSMVRHLEDKVSKLEESMTFDKNDIILDIGSNDGTLLGSYKNRDSTFIGMDPTANKFKEFYKDDIKIVSDFFSAEKYLELENKPAKIITSISMFYDLEDPVKFAQDVSRVLSPNGIWHFEQSYLPLMIKTNSYDTICHEHLEYYSFEVVEEILKRANLRALSVDFNNINGGSFSISACHKNSNLTEDISVLNTRISEKELNLNNHEIYNDFANEIEKHKKDLITLLEELKSKNKSIYGFGASTKGNVTLQHCKISTDLLDGVFEVNESKFGKFTPGSSIPIINQIEIDKISPDYLLILPWHFKKDIIARNGKKFQDMGIKLIFPFPAIEII
ncbi:class I SAM-dependent methyltransferase [Gammaproteobacteria bacterium]|nr:class I SAM-dependent methyltransferase [Gammaproteobacteria bacterium]